MKTLLTIFTLVFTLIFSSASFAEWTKVTINEDGNAFYVDLERIRKHDGYVYYWVLNDYLKPTKYGSLSSVSYFQGDCKLFRHKRLSGSYYEVPMGKGRPESVDTSKYDWDYPNPGSVGEYHLNSVCNH